ncbi:MAG TPA: cell division protein FtsA, partial [Azospirillaceae bacterium]|nr:cell division protein FtsA [Azospirillaceae bacterium]
IIQPRLEEIFELVRGRLDRSGLAHTAGRRVVLTGGACQLPGIRDLAQLVLDKQVRLGRPTRLGGLAESVSGPAFSTVAGLLQFAMLPQPELPVAGPDITMPLGFFGRVGLWLRENL